MAKDKAERVEAASSGTMAEGVVMLAAPPGLREIWLPGEQFAGRPFKVNEMGQVKIPKQAVPIAKRFGCRDC